MEILVYSAATIYSEQTPYGIQNEDEENKAREKAFNPLKPETFHRFYFATKYLMFS